MAGLSNNPLSDAAKTKAKARSVNIRMIDSFQYQLPPAIDAATSAPCFAPLVKLVTPAEIPADNSAAAYFAVDGMDRVLASIRAAP